MNSAVLPSPVSLSQDLDSSRDPAALEALTCDLWYTLIYPTPEVRTAIEQARKAVWIAALQEAGCSAKRAETWANRIEEAAEQAELDGRSPSWDARVRRWSQRIGVSLDPTRLAERYTNVPLRQVQVAPGADEALGRIKRRGLRLAIVSNVTHEPPMAIRDLLAFHRLDRWFESVVLSTEVGRAKPRREPFRKALAELGAAPGRTVHIGDSPVDLEGARRAGIRPLLYTGLDRWKPEHLQKLHTPWMKGALKVDRWEDVPRAMTAYRALPSLPREV